MDRARAVVVRLLLAGFLASMFLVAPGPAGSGGSAVLAASCPSEPVTIGKVASADGLACYGGRLLTFRAWVQPPCDGCGGAAAYVLSPLWLDGLLGSSVVLSDGPRGGQLPAFVPPALGQCSYIEILASCPFRSYVRRWVTVSGHFDGPVARTCRFGEHPPGPDFPRAAAVDECRRDFIVLGVGPAAATAPGSAPDTATAPATDPADVPDRPGPGPWVLGFAVAMLAFVARSLRRREAAA